ncbi:helix-turn-helix domain-containing protein [Mycobacterium sp.]|uniref:helix-turn-helix domain-containing protein n=1 Tax=Mycobacterium sp. TaxID=1785 RepID=UPI0031CFBF04
MENEQFPPLVAIPKVPEFIGGISRSKVYELIDAGELRRIRIGRRAFISGDSIAAFLRKVLTSGDAA